MGIKREDYIQCVGLVIRRLRGERSQADVARMASTSASTLSRIERGEACPDLVDLRWLAHALGTTPYRVMLLVEEGIAIAASRDDRKDHGPGDAGAVC